VCVRKR
jgi:hypothetical protein